MKYFGATRKYIYAWHIKPSTNPVQHELRRYQKDGFKIKMDPDFYYLDDKAVFTFTTIQVNHKDDKVYFWMTDMQEIVPGETKRTDITLGVLECGDVGDESTSCKFIHHFFKPNRQEGKFTWIAKPTANKPKYLYTMPNNASGLRDLYISKIGDTQTQNLYEGTYFSDYFAIIRASDSAYNVVAATGAKKFTIFEEVTGSQPVFKTGKNEFRNFYGNFKS